MKKHQKLMLTYGNIIAGVSIALTMLQYTLNAYNGKPLTVFLFGILPILVLALCIFLGIYQSKERSFRQMIKVGLGISILFAVIAAIFWVIFIKYIAPTHLETLNSLQLEAYKGEHPEVEYQRDGKYTGPYFSHRTVNVDNILDIDPEAFEIPSGQQIMCQIEKKESIGYETWTSLVIVPPEKVREKASQIRAEQQKQEEAAKRERTFYADVENAIACMESFGNKLPVELQKQRLALTIDLRYVAYGDENSAEKLNELITKVTSWCAACGEHQSL